MFALDTLPQKPMRVFLHGLALGLASFRRLIALTSVLGFIGLIPAMFLAEKAGDSQISGEFMLQMLKQGHNAIAILALQFLILTISLYINTLVIYRIDGTVHDKQDHGDLLQALHKMPSLLLALLLVIVTLLVGYLISILLGMLFGAIAGVFLGHAAVVAVFVVCIVATLIYICIYIIFFQFAIVLDGKGAVEALNFSTSLVFRNWWRTFQVLLYLTFIIAGIAIMAVLPFAIITPHAHWLEAFTEMDTGRTLLIKGVLRLVATVIFAPFGAGILYVLYHDLKLRRVVRTTPTSAIQA
ncbi:MAG: hypothetical protein KGL13_02310 [Gammaproteobacteria bacterium]|nr:hypothetical protein [Gammaproteobacteria bacterium]